MTSCASWRSRQSADRRQRVHVDNDFPATGPGTRADTSRSAGDRVSRCRGERGRGMVTVRMSGVTHRGTARSRNEDSLGFSGGVAGHRDGSIESLVVADRRWMAVVADGLGGHPAGDVASRLAVDALLSAAPTSAEELVAAVHGAHALLVTTMAGDVRLRGMASTIVAVLISDDEYVIANVGDSEAFALTDGGFSPLTVLDVSPDDVGPHGFRSSTLTQYLGGMPSCSGFEVHVNRGSLGPGQRFLLCSDGLTGAVPRAEIDDLVSHESGEGAVRSLLAEALASGHGDDITIVLTEIDP